MHHPLQEQLQQVGAFNEGLRARLEYGQRVQVLLAACFLSACYLHLLVRRLAPSFASLVAILPLLMVNTWLPTIFSCRAELLTRVVSALLTAWLGNFKAIGLCMNRGPLAGSRWNLLQFSLLYLLPIYPRQDGPVKKGRLTDSAGAPSKLLSLAAAHFVALSLFAYMLAVVPMHTGVKHYIYGLALCSFVSFIMNGPAAMLTAFAELDVVPPFDRPWMATSLADFWGRRWNNTVSLTLRSLLYDPVVEGCFIHRATPAAAAAAPGATGSSGSAAGKAPRVSLLRRLGGTAATFGASGLMHEVMLLYALHEGNTYPAGFWFLFFFVQFPLLVAEDLVRRRLRARGVKLPRPVLHGWAHLVILCSAYFLWFPPIETHTDLAVRVVDAVNGGVAAAGAGLQGLLGGGLLGARDAAQAAAAVSGSVSHAAAAVA